jgi:hypothetical protein
MAATISESEGTEVQKPEGEVAVRNSATRELEVMRSFAEMAAAIPTDDGDPTARILGQVLSAGSVEALNDPWETEDTAKLLGRVITVSSLKRQESTLEGGLGMYLVVTAVDTNTGETLTFTTGSVSVVAQLVKAHALGALPLKCELVQSDRPSKNGRHPQHLKVYGSGPDAF